LTGIHSDSFTEYTEAMQVRNVGDEDEVWAALHERDRLLERKGRQLEAALATIARLRAEAGR
jgi:hypothetical protein